ncbi:Hsp70 family protein, partial [Patescibacteria group bacterium]|nr:Hsp70 family protein [Patescibacteria group bacterium]
QIFSTAADSQPSVEIHVLQGEREMAVDNKTLGRFTLSGIAPAPRGIPQIEVTFDIDANGILNVKAADKATGKEQAITIQSSSGLSKDEIAKMQKDAELHAEEDKKKKEEAEVRNTADNMVFQTEKFIKDSDDKIKAEDKTAMTEKVEALKKIKDGTDLEAIKSASKELEDLVQKIGAAMYQAAAANAAPAEGQAEPAADANKAEEANFEEVKQEASADSGETK